MNPLDDLDMKVPPLTEQQKKGFAKKAKTPTDRERIIALCKLAGRELPPNVIQDVFAGDDKKRRTEVHRVISKMIEDGTFGITVDWRLRLRGKP